MDALYLILLPCAPVPTAPPIVILPYAGVVLKARLCAFRNCVASLKLTPAQRHI